MEKKGTKTVLKCTISTYTYTSKIVGARCVYWRTDFLVLSIHGTPYLVGLYIPCRYGIFIISTLVGINSIRGEVERRILTDMWVVQLFFSDFKCHINITSAKTTIQTILVSYMHCFESWGTHHIWYYGLGMDFRLDDNVRNLKGISSLWSLYLLPSPIFIPWPQNRVLTRPPTYKNRTNEVPRWFGRRFWLMWCLRGLFD